MRQERARQASPLRRRRNSGHSRKLLPLEQLERRAAARRDPGHAAGEAELLYGADGVASADDYVVYRDHPLHRALISERISAHVAERAAVQFDTPM